MWNKLKGFQSIVWQKYHCVVSGYGVSGKRCTTPSITLIGMIWVVLTLNGGLHRYLPLCNDWIRGSCLSSSITIRAVGHIDHDTNVWTKVSSLSTLDLACASLKRHYKSEGMNPAVDLQWLSGLVPIQRSTVQFLDGLCFLHLVDRVQQTISCTSLSHCKDITRIATALYRMYFASFRWLMYWSWPTYSVKSAKLSKHQLKWIHISPFGIAHNSAN